MIQFFNVAKKYDDRFVLQDINLEIEKGEFVFLVGPTGSGKTTLLKLITRQELPTKGQIMVGGRSVCRLKPKEVCFLRRKIGFIFQDFKLLEDRTVYENIAFALQVQGFNPKETKKRVEEALDLVGLRGRENAFPRELSGGEQQRIALARATAGSPLIILADEPTGNLDPVTSLEIVRFLEEINLRGVTLVMATHAWEIVNRMQKRVIRLDRGNVVADVRVGEYGYVF